MHGYRSSVNNDKAQFFLNHALQHKYSWSNFDLPCHGSSEGKFPEFRISSALTALTEVIRQFRDVPILLFGVSMGAWLSILAARKLANAPHTNIVAAVLVAPAFDFVHHYFNQESLETLQQWQRDGVRQFNDLYDNEPYELEYGAVDDGLQYGILQQSATYDFPIRIFHGDRDEIAPLGLSQQFKADAVDSDIALNIMKGGDHSLDLHRPAISAEVDRMFKKFGKQKAKAKTKTKARAKAKAKASR